MTHHIRVFTYIAFKVSIYLWKWEQVKTAQRCGVKSCFKMRHWSQKHYIMHTFAEFQGVRKFYSFIYSSTNNMSLLFHAFEITSHSLNLFPFSSTQVFVLDLCHPFSMLQFNALITLATFPAENLRIKSILVPRRWLLS